MKDKYPDYCNQPNLPIRIKQICDGTSDLPIAYQKVYLDRLTNVPNTEPPGLIERGLSFVGAIADYAFAGFPAMPEGESERRLSICRACPEFKPETSQCGVCTCYMNIKAHMATAACPLNKWGVATPVENKEGLPPVRDNPSQENEF